MPDKPEKKSFKNLCKIWCFRMWVYISHMNGKSYNFSQNFANELLMYDTHPEAFIKIWSQGDFWHHVTSFRHLPVYHLSIRGAKNSEFNYFCIFFFAKIEKLMSVLSFWGLNHINWAKISEVTGFYLFLRNVLWFNRILPILAQFLMMSSIFSTILIFCKDLRDMNILGEKC